MTTKIEIRFTGTHGIMGDVVTRNTRLIFGPPDVGLKPPGFDPDATSTALVISAKVGHPDPDDDDWRNAVRVLRQRWPDRAIYLMIDNNLVPVGFYNSVKGETAAQARVAPSARPGQRQQAVDITPRSEIDVVALFRDLNATSRRGTR